MELVKSTSSLKDHVEVNKIIQKITIKIHEIPNYNCLKMNLDLSLFVLNLVSNAVKNKKVDVISVALKILVDIFTLTTDESDMLKKQFEYIISNNQLTLHSKAYQKFRKYLIYFLGLE